MAALNFPNSPTVNQQYSAPSGALYTFDGAAWTLGGPIVATPVGPAGGDLSGTYPNPTIIIGRTIRQSMVLSSFKYAAGSNITSTTNTEILRGNITSSGGPILVSATPFGALYPSATGVHWIAYQLFGDGSIRGEWIFQAEIPAASATQGVPVTTTCFFLDAIAAGAHTYSLQVKVDTAATIYRTGNLYAGEMRLWELL